MRKTIVCPNCASKRIKTYPVSHEPTREEQGECKHCGAEWRLSYRDRWEMDRISGFDPNTVAEPYGDPRADLIHSLGINHA